MTTYQRVAGYCPMGCGQTLFLGDEDAVTCSYLECPRRTAVDELLADRETEHVVEFRPGDFIVRHPLRERLDDDLMTCELHAHIAGLAGPPVQPGRYRADGGDRGWAWEHLDVGGVQ